MGDLYQWSQPMNSNLKLVITVLIALLCSTCFISCADDTEVTSKAQIRSYARHMSPLIESSGETIEGERLPESEIFAFNRHGEVLLQFPYNSLEEKWDYEYDVDGKLIEMTNCRSELTVLNAIFEYNEEGNFIKGIMSMPPDMAWTYACEFDEDGIMYESSIYADEEIPTQRTVPEYDANGNKVEEIIYYSSGSPQFKHTYKYGDSGTMIETSFYEYSKGVEKIWETTKYNAKGDEEEVIRYAYSPDRFVYATIIFSYVEYDEYGNWIKRNMLRSDESKMLQYAQYRVIDYYP